MQTFMPLERYGSSLRALDPKRLNAQIKEANQILGSLLHRKGFHEFSKGFAFHPATLAWEDAEGSLLVYIDTATTEAASRGISVTGHIERTETYRPTVNELPRLAWMEPWWFNFTPFLKRVNWTHQARLYLKAEDQYPQYRNMWEKVIRDRVIAGACCDGCQYFWPHHHRKNCPDQYAMAEEKRRSTYHTEIERVTWLADHHQRRSR